MEESLNIDDEELQYLIYLNLISFAQLNELTSKINSKIDKFHSSFKHNNKY